MTDKQIIETLKNIKNYCGTKKDCTNCAFVFQRDDDFVDCVIIPLGAELANSTPYDWNMNKFEELLNE